MSSPRISKALPLLAAGALAASAARGAVAASPACERRTLGFQVADIPSVEVRPRFLLNGQPFPGGGAGVGLFTLWASKPSELFDGPQLLLGESDEPPQPVRVIPGIYDVYYSWQSGDLVPRNFLTRVLRSVAILRDRELTIDVSMVTVSGFKRHNGEAFPDDGSAAELTLRAVGRPGRVPLGDTLPSEFQVRLIPGVYNLEYDWSEGDSIPRNRHATVRAVRLVKDAANLVLNVPSVAQDFIFLHNGAAFPASIYESGTIVLRRGSWEEARVGNTYQLPPRVILIPGVYDVHWRHIQGSTVPGNQDARFRKGLVINGALRTIDVPSVEVSGDIRLNGLPPPQVIQHYARLWLETPDRINRMFLGATLYGSFNLRVVPGAYDIIYEHAAGDLLPSNARATIERGWRVAARPVRAINIPSGPYEGTFLLNGEPFPNSPYEFGRVYLLPLEGEGESVLLGATRDQSFSRRVIPGLYRSAYALGQGETTVPVNTLTTFGPVRRVLRGDGSASESDVLDVRAGELTVSYEHRGVPLPEGGPANARLNLYRNGNSLTLPESSEGAVAQVAMEGRFDLFYHSVSGPGLPRNAFMPFACWNLAP
jgi:hypothetical protein